MKAADVLRKEALRKTRLDGCDCSPTLVVPPRRERRKGNERVLIAHDESCRVLQRQVQVG